MLLGVATLFSLRSLVGAFHGGLHTRGESVVRVQVGFHGIFHALLLLNSALSKNGGILRASVHRCFGHGGLNVLFHLSFGWVVVVTMLVISEESVRIEQDLVNDQNDCVAKEDEQLGEREDLFVLNDIAI